MVAADCTMPRTRAGAATHAANVHEGDNATADVACAGAIAQAKVGGADAARALRRVKSTAQALGPTSAHPIMRLRRQPCNSRARRGRGDQHQWQQTACLVGSGTNATRPKTAGRRRRAVRAALQSCRPRRNQAIKEMQNEWSAPLRWVWRVMLQRRMQRPRRNSGWRKGCTGP